MYAEDTLFWSLDTEPHGVTVTQLCGRSWLVVATSRASSERSGGHLLHPGCHSYVFCRVKERPRPLRDRRTCAVLLTGDASMSADNREREDVRESSPTPTPHSTLSEPDLDRRCKTRCSYRVDLRKRRTSRFGRENMVVHQAHAPATATNQSTHRHAAPRFPN